MNKPLRKLNTREMTELDHVNSEIKRIDDMEAYFGRLSDADTAYMNYLQHKKAEIEAEPWSYEEILEREG